MQGNISNKGRMFDVEFVDIQRVALKVGFAICGIARLLRAVWACWIEVMVTSELAALESVLAFRSVTSSAEIGKEIGVARLRYIVRL